MKNLIKQRKIRFDFWPLFRLVILVGLAYIILYPIIYMLSMSLRPLDQVDDPSVVWIPRSFTFSTVIETFEALEYPRAFANTFMLCVVSSALTVVSCAFVGYGFARFKFPLKSFWFFGVILTILVPPQTILIPLITSMRYFDFFGFSWILELFTGDNYTVNLINSPFSMYLPAFFASGIRSGLFIFIYRQFFMGQPKELEDAAYIDGCGPLKTFIKIMLPLSSGAILVVILFSLVTYWNDDFFTKFFFDNVTTLRSELEGIESVVTSMYGITTSSNEMVAYKQAGAMLYVTPPLLLFIVFQRRFTESIERTGIVG